MRTPYQSRNILDECLLSSSKGSAECIRARQFLQVMKSDDPLLVSWQRTLSHKGNRAAVLNPNGKIVRSFRDIEGRARAFEANIDTLSAGAVVAVQIGNHEDWPSVFIACLRKQLVVLPVDQSISAQQREAALKICGASAVVSTGPTGNSPGIVRLGTAEAT